MNGIFITFVQCERFQYRNMYAIKFKCHSALCSPGNKTMSNTELNDLEKIVCLRKSGVSVERISVYNAIENQLLQLCTARTAWSKSDQAVRTVHTAIAGDSLCFGPIR